jgi:hypothetical protein
MIEKLNALLNSFVKFHEKIGVKYITMYIVYTLVIISALNWKSLVTIISDTIDKHKQEKHVELLKARDEISREIDEVVIDLRRDLDADRVFVVEYHNTVSNLRGLPFKFMSVTSYDTRKRYTDQFDASRYNQLNTGLFTKFIQMLRNETYIEFRNVDKQCDIMNICNLLIEDDSKNAVICQLSGVEIPLGFIVVEWVREENDNDQIDWGTVRNKVYRSSQVINVLLTNSKKL